MDLITTLQAVLLGIVEGLTEFLPVSSTGHLILVQDLLGFKGPPGELFPIVIQLGAILSVCWLYRAKLIHIVANLGREQGSQRYTVNVLMAFLPAAIIGPLGYKYIKGPLFNPTVVSIALILGGIAILVIERLPAARNPSFKTIESLPFGRAIGIGFFQCVSMIPGTSRSAATIMGALLVGLTREAAAEFSFILAIPTMFAATVYDLYKNRATLSAEGLELIAIGFVVSFFVALVVVKWLIGYVSRHGFTPFAIYRIILGIVMLGILYLR